MVPSLWPFQCEHQLHEHRDFLEFATTVDGSLEAGSCTFLISLYRLQHDTLQPTISVFCAQEGFL